MKPTGKKPFFTAKAIASLLAGDDQCHAKLWIKSRYWVTKRPSDFDFVTWQDQHNTLVLKRKAELEALGWEVRHENANKFELEGTHAKISGKPDLVAFKGDDVLVSDGKTGQQRSTDFHQVLLYLACLPLWAPVTFAGKTLSGEICYTGGVIEIPTTDLTEERKAAIWAKVRELSREQAFPTSPSANECQYCEIAECADRIEAAAPAKVKEF